MIYFNKTKKPAFTMIELIMVIIVLGILASLAIPRIDRDVTQEAADKILSNIRYTQHLALIDDKHLFDDPKWQRRYWKIMFATCSDGKYFFRIGSDDDMDSTTTFEKTEAAIDPVNGKPFYMVNNGNCDDQTVSNNIFIGKKYDINSVTGSGGCAGLKHIGFDHLGRPHVSFSGSNIPDYGSYMQNRCVLTFTFTSGDNFKINIEPETGYAFIDTQIGS